MRHGKGMGMTDDRFDDLTRRLETASSRRGVLKGVTALALGGLATRLRGSGTAEARARIKMACARRGQECSTAADAPGSLRCCPGNVCNAPDGETSGTCVSDDALCAPGELAEVCSELIVSSCGAVENNCAQVTSADGGCACVTRTCGPLCDSDADCGEGLCISAPGCCYPGAATFCAPPCGATQFTSETARRRVGGWQH
jgi:hypothetical protein